MRDMNESIIRFLDSNDELCLTTRGKGRLWRPIYDNNEIVITLSGEVQKKQATWHLKLDGKLSMPVASGDVTFCFTDQNGDEAVLKAIQDRSTAQYLSAVCAADSSVMWRFAEACHLAGLSQHKDPFCRICIGGNTIMQLNVGSFYLGLCTLCNKLNAGPIPEPAIGFLTPLAEAYQKTIEKKENRKIEKERLHREEEEMKQAMEAEQKEKERQHRQQVDRIYRQYAEKKSRFTALLDDANTEYKRLHDRMTSAERNALSLDFNDMGTCMSLYSNPLEIPRIKELEAVCTEVGLSSNLLKFYRGIPESEKAEETLAALASVRAMERKRPLRKRLYPGIGFVTVVCLIVSGASMGIITAVFCMAMAMYFFVRTPYQVDGKTKKRLEKCAADASAAADRNAFTYPSYAERKEKEEFLRRYLRDHGRTCAGRCPDIDGDMVRFAPSVYFDEQANRKTVQVCDCTIRAAVRAVETQAVSNVDISKSMRITYFEAERILGQLEDIGVVSHCTGDAIPRQVLIKDLDALESLLGSVEFEYEVDF